MRLLPSILGLLLSASLACATTLEQLSIDEMIAKSTSILRGRVLDARAVQRGSMIYTDYRVQILEQVKGADGSVVDVSVPGGSSNGYRQSFAGTPTLTPGTEYAILVWTGKNGVHHIMGLSQGLFNVERGSSGGIVLKRGALDARVVNRLGQEINSTPVELTWDELVRRVRSRQGAAQ